MPLGDDVDLDSSAERTERYTGADLGDLIRRAGLLARRESTAAQRVTALHLERALKETRASVTSAMRREHEAVLVELRREAPRRRPTGFLLAA